MDFQQPEPKSAAELIRICIDALTIRLPEGWRLENANDSDADFDATLVLTAPDATSARLIVGAKTTIERRDVAPMFDRLQTRTRRDGATALVVSRYLSPSVRDALAKQSASYVDATGNVRLQTNSPSAYISDRGQDRDPWRNSRGRPRGTLKGRPASGIVRSLVDFDRDWSVRELVDESDVSTGAAYRVLEYLQAEDLVEKTDQSRYRTKAWRRLIEAWSKDYAFQNSNRTISFIDPRGISNFSGVAQSTDSFEWAATGSMAASEWAPYAPTRAAFIYVENISIAAEFWSLRPAATGANVILAEPESKVAFKGVTVSRATGMKIAAPSQVAVDLLTSPGRNPAEGVELLNWMEQNEPAWRR